MKTYLVVIEGKPQGPFSFDELRGLKISPGTFVKSPEMDDYKEAHELSELRDLFGFKQELVQPQYFATLDSRLLAIAVDYFIIFGLYCLLALLAFIVLEAQQAKIRIALAGLVLIPLLRTCCAIVMEASPTQATPGKQLLGLKVCTDKGHTLSFRQSLVRNLLKWLSTLTLGIGYLSGFFDRKQQCLHDKLAGTLVVKERLL